MMMGLCPTAIGEVLGLGSPGFGRGCEGVRRGDLVSSWGEAIYVGMVELVAWPGGSNHRLNTSTLCSGRAAVSFASLGGWGGAHVGETWGESELCRRASTLPTWL
jgi:hypothetical protein